MNFTGLYHCVLKRSFNTTMNGIKNCRRSLRGSLNLCQTKVAESCGSLYSVFESFEDNAAQEQQPAPSLPNGPITQLSTYFTQKPGKTRRENPISAWQLPYLIIKMTSTLPTMTKDEHILIYPRLQYGQKLATISDHYWRQSRHYLRAKASQSRI